MSTDKPMSVSEKRISFFDELRRRNVFRVAIAYVLVAWVLLQIADVLFPALTLPEWTIRFVAGLLILGFPLAIFFAWAFELTPEGLKRESEVDRSQSTTHATGRKLNYVIIGVLAVAVLFLAREVWLDDEALEIARHALSGGIADRDFSYPVFLRLARDEALRTGNFEFALTQNQHRHPELLEDRPEVNLNNFAAAADLALLLQRGGDVKVASALLHAGLAWHRETHPPGVYGHVTGILSVELLALSGDNEAALEGLREAVDSGWRWQWRWHTNNENLASIRDDVEFKAIRLQLEADMAAQLRGIRALPDQGEFDLRSSEATE